MTTARQLHKFGGSSLADAQCYRRVATILSRYAQKNDLVVVSAAGKTTNQLIAFLEALNKDGRLAHEQLHTLRQYQSQLICELLAEQAQQLLLTQLNSEFAALGALSAPLSVTEQAQVQAHGEIWSARLLSALLNQEQTPACFLDARRFLRAEAGIQPEVDRTRSYPLLQEALIQHQQELIIITGFIAQNQQGNTVLLGRNGSDYSATSIGALANVSQVTIWSDVAGVYSADPRLVSDACLLPLLRLDEANELARLAAPVLHSRTLQPVAQSTMDLQLRCSYHPESGSTRIERVLASGRGAKIITSLDDVMLIELTFAHTASFSSAHQDVLAQLKKAQLTPLAYEIQADRYCLRLAYTQEISSGAFAFLQDSAVEGELKLKEGYTLVAAVGAGVSKNANHSYGFFQQLKEAPVEFFAQSCSGLSLVAILRHTALPPLVNRLHTQLFQAQKRIALALCGKGNIGGAWLPLFAQQKERLEKRYGMSFELVAIIDSDSYWLEPQGIDASRALSLYAQHAQPNETLSWLNQLTGFTQFDEIILLDVTASSELAQHYQHIAEQGMHLISANKIAGSSATGNYLQIKETFEKTGRYWLYNATVGAGLPINHTLRDLRESGDEITAISGIFSGTLSWLFQQYDGSIAFSELVDLAWQQGLTEPDPRHDLNGSDVMRKLVILAREAGFSIEPQQVKVDSLVPEALASLSIDAFFEHSHELDIQLAKQLSKAQQQGKVLRYIARLEKSGRASVGLEALEPDHPLANLLPCDNIFAIESLWYKDNPLVIRGPGAGKEVTAGAIQSDLNLLASRL